HGNLLPFSRNGRSTQTATDESGSVTDSGDRRGRVLVIACGMLAREILAVKSQLGLNHLDLTCLPADYHFHPDRIPAAMEAAIGEARAQGYDAILAGYGDCGTGGLLDRVLEKHGVQRLEGPHCFAFYQGAQAYETIADGDMLAFYM